MVLSAEKNTKGYKAVEQLPGCCVPACLQMIFRRHSIPFIPSQETIGNHLGLTIPPTVKKYFRGQVRISEKMPPGGYGTRINKKKYSLNTLFQNSQIPLKAEFIFINKIPDENFLRELIRAIVKDEKRDCIMCVQSGSLEGDPDPDNGHVILLSGADQRGIYFIEPGDGTIAKTTYHDLYQGMVLRSCKNWGGMWSIRSLERKYGAGRRMKEDCHDGDFTKTAQILQRPVPRAPDRPHAPGPS